ncbi:MAG: response regulator [Gemmataceae bacterium]|nr:response regulator [Gemmata sp.]MDW8198262.1 response regulator [Gemmataceae bacterium]
MGKSVLIVDDSRTIRQMLGDTLRSAGFRVLEGANGEEALRRVVGQTVHLVITDLNMPVMGGLALIEQLRAKKEFRFTPILVLTTESDESRKNQGRAVGATGWIVKPFDPERLIQVVKRLVA